MTDTKLLIVDDSLTIRAMMEEVLGRHSNAQIVGMASTGEEAVEMANRLLPDIILLDLKLPGLDGFAFLDAIHGHWHDMHVIVVSSSAKKDSLDCLEAFAHGAEACFDKARLVKCGEELATLIGEIAGERVRRNKHMGDAVTLPAVLHQHQAMPEGGGLALTA